MTRYTRSLFLIASFLCLIGFSFGQKSANVGTYKNGKTVYIVGKTYKTTGKPLVKRSSIPKTMFLKFIGLKSIPPGYQIDHILPLSQGGEDIPENMQLLTVVQHKVKTAIERGEVAEVNHDNIFFTTFDYDTQKPVGVRSKEDWQIQKYTSATYIDKELSSKKVLFTGPIGGNYYYNSNGKKTYVKFRSHTKPSWLDELNKTTTPLILSSDLYAQPNNNSSSSTSSQTSTGSVNKDIQTGPRGGKYYINSNGNKAYIKKN